MKRLAFGAATIALGCAQTPPEPSVAASLSPASESAQQARQERRSGVESDPPLTAIACVADADCGYDPRADRCSADPRANRQPKLIDQGIVCYCEAEMCAILRVAPVACEGDESCAVRLDPRPHPVAASDSHPHERGRPCVDFAQRTTCERTNICTMHDLGCAPQPGSGSLQQRTPSE